MRCILGLVRVRVLLFLEYRTSTQGSYKSVYGFCQWARVSSRGISTDLILILDHLGLRVVVRSL